MGKMPAPVKKHACKKKAPGSGNNGNGDTPWWVNCAGRAGFWGGVGMFGGAGGLTLDASCLLCLGFAAVGCGLNPIVFCAPLVDSCAEYCGAGVLKTLIGWLAGYLGAFIECIARHEGIKWV